MGSLLKTLLCAKHVRRIASLPPTLSKENVEVNGQHFVSDDWTNVTEKILSYVGMNLYMQNYHPLTLIKQKIVGYFYKTYIGRRGNPLFSVHENLSPIVSVNQNFDSLLIPKDHPSRKKGDCYYINKDYLLRAHATAHQVELIQMGLNNFLIIGDVYRRDEIDVSHYPVFHQLDAVRLLTEHDVARMFNGRKIFEDNGIRTAEKQEHHNLETTMMLEQELKTTLSGLAEVLFGKDVKYRWVETYFPFTHPSWELEVFYNGKWIEVLGCGIMEQKILQNAAVHDRVGWAFGLGLERLAMCLYSIPDIRLFWSTDTGFLSQFLNKSPDADIKYKPVSIYPQCINDISFWLPKDRSYAPNDFYDLVREVGGETVEQIILFDEFFHPKKQLKSHAYRIVYRHMEKTLTQKEVNYIHQKIAQEACARLGVNIR